MFARTERLLLRPGWVDDAPALARAVAHEEIVRNLALLPWPYVEDDARVFLEHVHGKGGPEFLIFARTDSAPALVGGIGFHADPDFPAGAPELGYWIAPEHWGKGFATEAAKAAVDIARHTLKIPALKSAYYVDNPASGRVLAKVGFRPTGRIVPRYSVGRRAEVQAVLMELDCAGDDDARAPVMRYKRPGQTQMMQMAA